MIRVRTARAEDDLSFWPGLGRNRLNRSQVLLAVEGQELLGALVYWDAGHDVIFIGDLRVLAETRKRTIVKKLIEAVVALGKPHLFFHCSPRPAWTALVRKIGAIPLGTVELFTIPTERIRDRLSNRRRQSTTSPSSS